MRLLRHPLVHRLLAVGLGALFIYASLDKIADPRAFAKIVYHYQVIGPNATLGFVPANLVAIVLPWLELIAGILLIAGFWRREAAAIVAFLLVVFVGAVGSTLARGIDIRNCGCFALDASGRSAGFMLIAGDLALLAAALVVAFAPVRAPASEAARAEGDPVTAL